MQPLSLICNPEALTPNTEQTLIQAAGDCSTSHRHREQHREQRRHRETRSILIPPSDTMKSTAGILLLVLLQMSGSYGQKPKNPQKPEDPIEKITVKENFSPSQFAGKWFLIGVASNCNYLKEENHRVEATIIMVSPTVTEKKTLPVSTFRKMDGICWQIKQEYKQTKVPGRFLLPVRGYQSNLDVLVGDTDYSSYAILYYQKQRKITIKLYARSANVGDAILDKYEQRIMDLGIDKDFTYYFPKYGFCDSADQFHILNA